MKRVAIVLLIIIVMALIGMICYTIFKGPVVEEKPPVIEPVKKMLSETIVVRDSVTKTDTQKRNVDVKMPAFDNLTDYSFQQTINQKIASSIDPYINEIRIVAEEGAPATAIYRYNVSYERYNNDDYVSLVVQQNYSTGGLKLNVWADGLRSNVWKDTYTVDVKNNRELTLADVCSSKEYKKIIIAEVNRQAKERDIELIAGNGLENIPNTQRFYIKDKKLYIYFEPASIAPYLDGEIHFEMPFEFVDGKFLMN